MTARQSKSMFMVMMAALALGWASSAGAQLPASGQTTSVRAADDGDLEAGATLSYTDNGDGTITDNNTGLQWEKKSDDGTIHDKDITYLWEEAFAVHVEDLNTGSGFADHTDWRVPNVKELQSIVNYGVPAPGPAVSPAFNNNCVGATVLTGSCTAASLYWSATTGAGNRARRRSPNFAWFVGFVGGSVRGADKGDDLRVRAVRDTSP